MTVIDIYEDRHGYIGTALNYHSAICFLIKNNWITDCTEIWNDELNQKLRLIEAFGSDWQEIILSWDIEKFNDFFNNDCLFEDDFLLVEVKVIEY